MKRTTVDLAVIGAGPAGLTGALQGAGIGKKVVVIDRLGVLGGASLNHGTIPSKALRRAIIDLTGFTQMAYFEKARQTVSMHDLMFRVSKVVRDGNARLRRQCAEYG